MSAVLVDLEQLADLVAHRVVALLDERGQTPTTALVDAAELARILSISRSTVYDNAALLGGLETGNGSSRPRLRFDPEKARDAWTRRVSSGRSQPAETPAPATVRRRTKRAGSSSDIRLLPVRGRSEVRGGDAA